MKVKRSFAIEEIKVGMTASYSQTITDADVKAFAGISGDHNAVHLCDEYAESSRYKKRIAHGLLTASFFSGQFLELSSQAKGAYTLGKIYSSKGLFI